MPDVPSQPVVRGPLASDVDPADRGETPATLRWTEVSFWPMTIAALVWIVTYTVQVVGNLDGIASTVTWVLVGITWIMFVVDYVARLALSRPKGLWFRKHLFDAAVMLLPVLRPIRLLGAITRLPSFTKTSASSLRAQLLIYGVGAALLLIWQISLMVLQFERNAEGATITSFPIALWWAICTVTTVGYGDYVPVTDPGRVAAATLMMGGVILLGLITASFASWVTERATRGREDQQGATKADVHELMDMIRERDERIARMQKEDPS